MRIKNMILINGIHCENIFIKGKRKTESEEIVFLGSYSSPTTFFIRI